LNEMPHVENLFDPGGLPDPMPVSPAPAPKTPKR
jgi:hypothetical protein